MIKPSNIHCLAYNFPGVSNSKYLQKPLYFVKSSLAFSESGVIIKKPLDINRLWTEVELGIFIKEDCEFVSENDAKNFVSGYSVCGDVTCENIYNRDHHLGFSKSRENFCPCSKVNFNNIDNFDLRMTTFLNGKRTQTGNLKDMLYSPYKSISYLSSITKLKKNDLIILGTPPGWQNNYLNAGDDVSQIIDGIGELNYKII